MKWDWTGQVARQQENWGGQLIRWRPWTEKRPKMRRIKENWYHITYDRC